MERTATTAALLVTLLGGLIDGEMIVFANCLSRPKTTRGIEQQLLATRTANRQIELQVARKVSSTAYIPPTPETYLSRIASMKRITAVKQNANRSGEFLAGSIR